MADLIPAVKTESGNNPFNLPATQGQTQAGNIGTLATTEATRSMAEVQAAVFMAKQFPRDPQQAYENVLKACQRPGLANRAIYEYARGGTNISGPSIRLAEAIASEWGNINYGFIELDRTKRYTVAQAYAWNLETNVKAIRTVTVPHERHTRNGVTVLTDPRDIYELVANNMARRLRACILEVIPGDVVDDAIEECIKTQRAHADTSQEGIKKLVDAFERFGVTKADIEAYIQRSISAITAGNVVKLRSIYQSLADGMATPSDFFKQQSANPTRVIDMKAQLEQKPKPLPPIETEQEPEPEKPKRGRKPKEPEPEETSDDQVAMELSNELARATSLSDVTAVFSDAQFEFQAGNLSKKDFDLISTLCDAKKKEIQK